MHGVRGASGGVPPRPGVPPDLCPRARPSPPGFTVREHSRLRGFAQPNPRGRGGRRRGGAWRTLSVFLAGAAAAGKPSRAVISRGDVTLWASLLLHRLAPSHSQAPGGKARARGRKDRDVNGWRRCTAELHRGGATLGPPSTRTSPWLVRGVRPDRRPAHRLVLRSAGPSPRGRCRSPGPAGASERGRVAPPSGSPPRLPRLRSPWAAPRSHADGARRLGAAGGPGGGGRRSAASDRRRWRGSSWRRRSSW